MKNFLGPIIIALSIIIGALIISSNLNKSSNVGAIQDCYKKAYLANKEKYLNDKSIAKTKKEIEKIASYWALQECDIK